MVTFLDLLVIVFLAVFVHGALLACLMFFVKNTKVRKISFYVVVALAIYCAYIGIRIGLSFVDMQCAVGAAVGIAAIASLVIERMYKGDEKKFMIARIISVASLAVGIINAFI